MEELGIPIANTTMLGSLLRAKEVVPLETLIDPFKKRFGRIAEKNIKACKRAFKETSVIKQEGEKQ
jgi:pyruvate ferredoxin oxidoreductase gamma subunit